MLQPLLFFPVYSLHVMRRPYGRCRYPADVLLPGGKLYGPHAERVLPQLETLTRFAHEKGIVRAGSVDRRFPDD
jgi:hypothetical protein